MEIAKHFGPLEKHVYVKARKNYPEILRIINEKMLMVIAKETKRTEKLFESLMGKKSELRFRFIKENENFTTNLDY